MSDRKPVRTWYSVTGANGRLWIESNDLEEITDSLLRVPAEYRPVIVRRHDVYEYARTTVIDQGQGLRQMLEELG